MSPKGSHPSKRHSQWTPMLLKQHLVRARLLLPAVSIAVMVFGAPTFSKPQASPRRQLLSSTVVATGGSLATIVHSEKASAISVVLQNEIVRSAQGLNELVARWDKDVQVEDRLTEGANVAREMLFIKYVKDLVFTVPEGETIGIDVDFKCYVSKVMKPQYGFAVGDYLASVNGLDIQGNTEFLDRYVKRAQANGKPLRFVVRRTYPPLLDNMEKKLQDIYVTVDDDSALPDLEDVQLLIAETKVLSNAAASGTSVSYVIMNRFREAVTKLRDRMVPVAKAIV